MLDCRTFFRALGRAGIQYFAGVPDSLLKHACACIADLAPPGRHRIAANEGSAVALAAGHHLATGEVPLVYLQNSGLGNAVNPLMSLAAADVYGIPIVLLVGWRGEPGRPDEPQHMVQGRVTRGLLEALDIPFWLLPTSDAEAEAAVVHAAAVARGGRPVALLARASSFAPYERTGPAPDAPLPLRREEVVEALAIAAGPDSAIVSTTGMMSRELYEHRVRTGQDPRRDFLTVGSMGHASQIALGLAAARPQRRVVCLDGDGSVIMHMGGLATIGATRVENLTHVVVNNGAHDSVGGQPTVGLDIDLCGIARACGYPTVLRADTRPDLLATLTPALSDAGPTFLEVRVQAGARPDLGRPAGAPHDNKAHFMAMLRPGAR